MDKERERNSENLRYWTFWRKKINLVHWFIGKKKQKGASCLRLEVFPGMHRVVGALHNAIHESQHHYTFRLSCNCMNIQNIAWISGNFKKEKCFCFEVRGNLFCLYLSLPYTCFQSRKIKKPSKTSLWANPPPMTSKEWLLVNFSNKVSLLPYVSSSLCISGGLSKPFCYANHICTCHLC